MKILLVTCVVECPNCGKMLGKGDIAYDDEYRGNVVCGYCKEEYEELVASEEQFIKL